MTVTITGINNTGSKGITTYNYPYFEIQNTGSGAITKITITYSGISLIWEGSLAAGKTLKIEQTPLLNPTIDDVKEGYIYGVKIQLPPDATNQSISFTKVGGTTMKCTVKVTPRYNFTI